MALANVSAANLIRRRESVLKQCKNQINWWVNEIVIIEDFEIGDVIFVAAVTKFAIYKAHLFAIQYTKISPESNFYYLLCRKFSNYSQIEERFFKTELLKITSETIFKEFHALKRFQEFQVHPPNVNENFENLYNERRDKESEPGFFKKLVQSINESEPRQYIVKARKPLPTDIIKRGNKSKWTEVELEQRLLDLCRASGIDAIRNSESKFPNNIVLKVPTDDINYVETVTISVQKVVCMHIWEADFLFIIKEHLYSEGYHPEEQKRIIIKSKIDSDGITRKYEEEVTDIYKHEKINFETIFIAELYLVENTSSNVYRAARHNTLNDSIKDLFSFFSHKEFTSLFQRDCFLLTKHIPHQNLQRENLDNIFPIGSIICPKMGSFYHPGAIYLGKGLVGHAPLWKDEHFVFKSQDLLDFMGPLNELVEVKWRFRPYSDGEIIKRSRELERGHTGTNSNPDVLVYRCAMDISVCFDHNNKNHELFELFREKNFTEVFKRNQEMLAEIVKHTMNALDERQLDAMFRFGSVLCASRTILFGTVAPFKHAAVYLGNGTVAHVASDSLEANKEANIFKIQTFAEFLKGSTEVKEYRWRYSPFSPEQIWSNAKEMTKKTYKYSARYQNCENLAFQCAMDINFSPQMKNPLKRFGALAFGGLLPASVSASNSMSNQISGQN